MFLVQVTQYGDLVRARFKHRMAKLDGKVVVITGGNTGIGRETVLQLARRGARVITGCRDLGKAEAVVREARDKYGADLVVEHLDLADLESVKRFADR